MVKYKFMLEYANERKVFINNEAESGEALKKINNYSKSMFLHCAS